MKTRKKKSTSFDQNKLKVLCDNLCDRIEDLLNEFGLEYKLNNKFVSMSCPIHGGDNDGALNLYHTGDNYRGNWICRTHGCEQIFQPSILGFIRGILSRNEHGWSKSGDSVSSFNDSVEFATNFLNLSLNNIKVSKVSKEKNNFINNTKILTNDISSYVGPDRNTVIKNLNIPSEYFISRGFDKDILIKYDIGDCKSNNKEMSNRAVVPVYDMEYQYMVGCSGRSIYNKCDKCKSYHSDNCPDSENLWKYSKWKHNSGFKTQNYLYNYWFAKEVIQDTKKAILVESPGNVWRLEENGIHNSLAMFGTNLSDKQKTLLDMSGAMELIIIMDNDDAGKKAIDQIYKKCHRTYNVSTIFIEKNDIADMSTEEIQQQIKSKL